MNRVQGLWAGVVQAGKGVDDYWFGKGSPTALGVFRILMSSLAFINLLLLCPDWEAWFSERGFVPRSLNTLWNGPDPTLYNGGPHVPRVDVLMWTTNDVVNHLFFLLVMLACVLTALGIWTRVSSILLALGIVTLHHRDVMILHGGDTVLRVCCLYLAVGPSGAACSLDRLIGLWRGTIAHGPVTVSLWAQRLLTYNVALMYLTTVWIKRLGTHWMDGTATWYTARLAEFYRFPVPGFIYQMPFVRISTFLTVCIEFSMGTLVFFRPLRKYVLLSGVLFHLAIDYSMNIPLFSYLVCAMYINFFDGEEVSAWAQRLGHKLRAKHVTVRLPQGYRLTRNAVAFLDSVDPLKLVDYLPGTSPQWTAHGPGDRPLNPRWASLSRSLGAWVVAPIPGLWTRLLDQGLEPEVT